MGKKGSAPSRRYTDEFKVEAVRLGESIGGNPAAKRLDVPESNLWNWMRLKRTGRLAMTAPGTSGVKRPNSELEAEVSRLRRELANTKLDLEIVKKAAAYFAKESR